MLEKIDFLEGVIILSSLAGGTGSGKSKFSTHNIRQSYLFILLKLFSN